MDNVKKQGYISIVHEMQVIRNTICEKRGLFLWNYWPSIGEVRDYRDLKTENPDADPVDLMSLVTDIIRVEDMEVHDEMRKAYNTIMEEWGASRSWYIFKVVEVQKYKVLKKEKPNADPIDLISILLDIERKKP